MHTFAPALLRFFVFLHSLPLHLSTFVTCTFTYPYLPLSQDSAAFVFAYMYYIYDTAVTHPNVAVFVLELGSLCICVTLMIFTHLTHPYVAFVVLKLGSRSDGLVFPGPWLRGRAVVRPVQRVRL